MTVYALSRQKVIPFRLTLPLISMREWLCEVNRRGVISSILIAAITISLTAYISALFLTFHLGFAIQEKDRELQEAEEALISLELETRKLSAEFVNINSDILAGMEKISEIEYIIPRSVVDSRTIISQ